MRISDSLRFKRDLVESITKHRKVYADLMLASFTAIGSQRQDLSQLEISSLDNVVNNLGFGGLRDAELFFVGKNVIPEYLNRSLGPEPKQFGTVYPYTRSGLAVFEHPIIIDPYSLMRWQEKGEMGEREWDTEAANFIPISAVSWSVGTVPTASHPSLGMEVINKRPGVVIMLWSATSDVKTVWEKLTGEKLGQSAYPVYPLTYASAAFGGWFIAESGLTHEDEDPANSIYYNGDTPETASGATAVVMVHELWAMLEERILMSSRQRFSSKYGKMMRRLNMNADVSVIQLRQVEYVGDRDTDHRFIDWQHRWEVRGHYRRITDRHTGEERLVWVRAHTKGPEGKPLRDTEKINALTR
jgi:hypothetical protein